jgi:BioD-like phosphotransacetylase family protein
VPIVSVATDTVMAIDGIRRLFGRLGVHDKRKIALIVDEISANIDLDRLVGDLGR